jgi:uncharacterized protein involved in tolerance to divalent cations
MNQRRKAKHYAADYWQAHITACEQSHLTQQQYCREHQLTISTYYNWKKKLQSDSDIKSPIKTEPLIELSANVLTDDNFMPPNSWDMELSLGQGITLRLRSA